MADPVKKSRTQQAIDAQNERREHAKREYDAAVADERNAEKAAAAASARASVAEMEASARQADMAAEKAGVGVRPDGTRRLPNLDKPDPKKPGVPVNPRYTEAVQLAEKASRAAEEARQLARAASDAKTAAAARRSAADTAFKDSTSGDAINRARMDDDRDASKAKLQTATYYGVGAALGGVTAHAMTKALGSAAGEIAKEMPRLALGGEAARDAAYKIQGQLDAVKAKGLADTSAKANAVRSGMTVAKFGAVVGGLYTTSKWIDAQAAEQRANGNEFNAQALEAFAIAERAAAVVAGTWGLKTLVTDPNSANVAKIKEATERLKDFSKASADAAKVSVATTSAESAAKAAQAEAVAAKAAADAKAADAVKAKAAADKAIAKANKETKTAAKKAEAEARAKMAAEEAQKKADAKEKKKLIAEGKRKQRDADAKARKEAGTIQAGKTKAGNAAVAADRGKRNAAKATETKIQGRISGAVAGVHAAYGEKAAAQSRTRAEAQQARRARELAEGKIKSAGGKPAAAVVKPIVPTAALPGTPAMLGAAKAELTAAEKVIKAASKLKGASGRAGMIGGLAVALAAASSVGSDAVAAAFKKERTDPYTDRTGRVFANGRKIARD